MKFLPRALLLVPALTLAACSKDPQGPDPVGPGAGNGGGSTETNGDTVKEEVPLADLLDSLPLDSADTGALHGIVSVEGEVPERFALGARKVADCTHHADVEHLSDILIAEDGKLCFAYLSLESGFEDLEVPAAPSEPVMLDQRGCIYTPHVLGAQVGQTVKISNSDPATHNVNVKSGRNRDFNMSQAAGQAPLEYTPRRADTVRFKCDVHPWMFALVHVCDHPWFAVSNIEGQFSIDKVPPGEYVLRVEHEELGVLRRRVVVRAGESTGVALALEAR